MSTAELVNQEIQAAPPPSKPRPVTPVAVIGLILALAGVALMVDVFLKLRDYNKDSAAATIIGGIFILGSLCPLLPCLKSFAAARKRAALLRDDQLVESR